MMTEIKEQLDNLISKDLEEIGNLEIGSEEAAKVIREATNLMAINQHLIDASLKAIELDNEKEANQLKIKELELRTKKDEELVKIEKKKVWIENGTRLLGFAAGLTGTVLAILADRRGWFVSKLGLQQNKPKYF